jgi:hypothetical protein
MLDVIMENGICTECGAKEADGLSCRDQFGNLLAWEQYNSELRDLHFWNVSCYMLQHPSNFTKEGYELTKKLFCDAYDHNWGTSYILKKNREMTTNKTFKIVNPVPFAERVRVLTTWDLTVHDVYAAGEKNAVENVLRWRKVIREAFLRKPPQSSNL